MAATTAHKLCVPIMAHGEEWHELHLRRPTTQEVRAIKALPYKIDKSEDVSLDMDVACKYVAVCAGIPQSSVDQLDLADLNALAWMVASFFMAPASSPQTS
ncbi:phage tail assembly protein [Pseudomonas protegens]|uniref:phage tail assembly protein n=1 Tax=Pseudomonas protegens TaxID=380021 RepID=UPI0022805B13|nr:phage tail assembly protein [Pseudomonas protegens]MCY7262721.1 phage tail assembly protein [Pseudomonas protegens]